MDININAKRLARQKKFELIDLYPVISSEFTAGRPVLDILKMVADGGAKIVQLREKHCTKKELYQLALSYREITSQYDMLLIINDHADIATAVDADGVHLGQDDLPLAVARGIFDELILGSSTHDVAEAIKAENDGCDYLNIGPIFATQTKELSMQPLGLAMLDEVKKHISVPFTVMGGIKEHHLTELGKHGSHRVAMVTQITQAENVTKTVEHLRELILTVKAGK